MDRQSSDFLYVWHLWPLVSDFLDLDRSSTLAQTVPVPLGLISCILPQCTRIISFLLSF